MVKGLPVEWGACFRTVILDSSGAASLAVWKDTIAVGLGSGDIITLNATTGSQTAILSGHTAGYVGSLTFSSDGVSLVSGANDRVVILWDVQTGGVVKAFHGHTGWVVSVSISTDYTTIASGSSDRTVRLWNIQTGACHHIMEQAHEVECVSFSPIHSQHLISASGGKVQQWDIYGHQTNPSYSGSHVAFSSDGTQLVLCQGEDIVVQNSDSGAIMAKFHIADSTARGCCFSPDGRLVAVVADYNTVYIWDTTGSDPHPVETFGGYTTSMTTSFVFSSTSSLIISSWDKPIEFWQFGTPSVDPVVGHPKSTPLASAPIISVTLHAKDGVFISSDSDGMVRIWDISTGLCKTSFQTPAKDPWWSDVQLADSSLISMWYRYDMIHFQETEKIHIWDIEKEKPIRVMDADWRGLKAIRLSGDGSKVFCLRDELIEAWSIGTGEVVGRIAVDARFTQTSLIVNGPRVWVYSHHSKAYGGWDPSILGSSSGQLPKTTSIQLSNTKLWEVGPSRIKDTTTGKVVLQLGGRFSKPFDVQLDGQYFLAHYKSGEIMILDFNHVLLW